MADIYKSTIDCYTKAAAVVPNDGFDLPMPARKLWIGTTGNLTVIPAGNNDASPVTFSNVPVGWFDNLTVRRVKATGTTASNIVAVD